MKISKALKAFVQDATQSDAYWVEHAKLEFSMALDQHRRTAQLTYAALAKKLGTSAAYISKVFRGDTNMTIETMVKLARATGGQLDIRVIDSATAINRWDLTAIQKNTRLNIVGPSVTYASHSAYYDKYNCDSRLAA